jgi:hypothetical protein
MSVELGSAAAIAWRITSRCSACRRSNVPANRHRELREAMAHTLTRLKVVVEATSARSPV